MFVSVQDTWVRGVLYLSFALQEDIKSLVAYIVENHIQAFRDITYVDTFAALAVRYEHQNQEKRRLDDSQDR